MLIYKICPASLWRAAEAVGSFAGAPVDLADGFIHFSTAAQLGETAARHFAGQSDLLLITVDATALGRNLRFEPSRGGDLFPHLYGELPLPAVRSVAPLALGPDGVPAIPPTVAAPASFDPAAAGWKRRDGSLFIGIVGPIWTKGEGEARRYGLLVETRHLNRQGIVHGGMIMTLADQALGLGTHSDEPQVTVQLDTHFVSGAREGEFIEVTVRIVRRARSMIFMSAEMTVGDRVVALANGVWKLVKPRR